MGANEPPGGADLCAVRLQPTKEKRGSARHSHPLPHGNIGAHAGGVLSAIEALFELRRLEPERLRMGEQILDRECLLAGEEPVVHIPILALVACAVGGLVSLEGQRMDRLKWEVVEDVAYLSGVDEVTLDLRPRLTDVAATEGSLEVSEVDEDKPRLLVAFSLVASDGEDYLGRSCGLSARRRAAPEPSERLPQEIFYLLQFAYDLRLAFPSSLLLPEPLDILLESLELLAPNLGRGWQAQSEKQQNAVEKNCWPKHSSVHHDLSRITAG